MIAAMPFPVSRLNLEQRYTVAAIIGKVSGAVHRNEKPKVAPACAYVPTAHGSSFAAPVMMPGSIDRNGEGTRALILRFSTRTRPDREAESSCASLLERGARTSDHRNRFNAACLGCRDRYPVCMLLDFDAHLILCSGNSSAPNARERIALIDRSWP